MCDHRRFTGLRSIGLFAAALFIAAAGAPRPVQADAGAPALGELAQRSWELAADGRFEDVLSQIEQLTEDEVADEKLAALRRQIVAHQDNERQRRQQAREQYEQKVEQLREHLANDELREALSSAVEAYGLAEDPDALLASDKITQLVERAEAEAAEREETGEWLRALSLYRGLETLFENGDRYSDRLKRVGRHVSLLRLYAPEQLQQLYREEAAARGEDEPELWNADPDEWQNQLRGITPVMLNESLHFGARQHVEGSSFEELLIGAIGGLEIFLDTTGLEKTFPALADADKTQPLRDYLNELRISVAQRDVPMSYAEAAQIVNRLMERNKSTLDLPEAVLVHELGDGAMSSLDDFSAVVWPHQKARFERTTQGSFSGVGIQITQVNRELTVVTPLEDTPAHHAGIRPGEKIVSIDGQSTLGMELDQAVDRITGEEGTQVVLGVQGPGDDQPREVELTRSSIRIVSVKGWDRNGTDWDFYLDPDLRIGYARATTFGPNTADELDAAVQSMQDAGGISSLVLDLRFNPGGRLDAAVDVTNRFLDSGTIVSTSQRVIAGGNWEASADRNHTVDDFPVVVLINKGSASASEIVAGALQAHSRALVVGENTFGKGSVQNLFRIGGDEAYLKLTTQYYRLPDGRIIHRRPGAEKWGIHPDVHVRMTEQQTSDVLEARMLLDVLRDDDEDFDPQAIMRRRIDEDPDAAPPVQSADEILERGMDPQLETALLLIKTRLVADAGR